MYYIIFCEDWCSVVPYLWINETHKTFQWPPKQAAIAIQKGIPPHSNWSIKSYRRIAGPYDNYKQVVSKNAFRTYKTYEMARQMEKKAEYIFTSEERLLDTLSQPSRQNKRSIKRPLFFYETQDNYDDTRTRKKVNSLPAPPSNYVQAIKHKNFSSLPSILIKDYHCYKECGWYKQTLYRILRILLFMLVHSKLQHLMICFMKDENQDEDQDEEQDEEQYEGQDESSIRRSSSSSISISSCKQTCNTNNFNSEEDEVDDVLSVNGLPEHEKSNMENNAKNDSCHKNSCCNACHKLQNAIVKKLNLIINILTNPETNQAVVTDKSNLLPNFPISNTEEFLKFEGELQTDKEIRKQFKSMIAKIGGKAYAGKTRNILKFILTDTLCQKLSWTGNKGSRPIKETAFASILTNYVSNTDKCTYHDVQKVIQEWLKHAGDCVKYLKKINNYNKKN
ncbi:uncharacterized protein [Anoplolepis gracilipes]|uniref:uncharacterized protein n=1 Tax=Anoplolepis gracilipes TaxID=354296 RepID=UPI003BA30BA7